MSFLTNLQERAVEGLKGFFTQYWDPDEKRNIIYTKGKSMLVDSEEEEILGLGGPSAGVAPSYLGKIGGINADFTVARTSDTQLTLSAFTPDVAQIYESDIEKIRQCTAAGVLVKEWTHINATINDSGASVLTVAEATFVAGDLITVFTNIPRLIDVSVANLNVDLTSVSGNYLIGKDATATNADFTTADNGDGDGILLSGYPDYASGGFVGDDIEFVRQTNAAGKVVETYSKDDADMNIAANVLTITGATFVPTDTFVIGTNVPRKDLDLPELEFSTNYVGKLTGGNGDFDISKNGATALDIDTFPISSITAFVAADIGLIRQMTLLGVWVADYTPYNATITVAGNVVTVAEATFGDTDVFILYTTVSRAVEGGSASAGVDFKIGSWDGTVTHASPTTLTLAGNHPAINNNSQVAYIKVTDSTLHTSKRYDNQQNGITILHAGGTLTIYGVAAPFAATNDYEVGISATPIGADIAGNAILTREQITNFGHYTDSEHVDEDNEGAQNDTKYTRRVVTWDSYKHMSFTYLLTSDDAHNDVRLMIYATNKSDYTLPDEDTAIVDSDMIFSVSEEVLGDAAGISINNGSVGENECIDLNTKYYAFIFELKYDEDDTAAPANAADIYLLKYY